MKKPSPQIVRVFASLRKFLKVSEFGYVLVRLHHHALSI